ncbi:hypothetical protein KC218_22385, partial [Mycobacterium tuberculosis]|nr:hypothetical protein [Mycobacterium tuberculosis]
DDESNPEQDLPACPGSFHFQGDNKRFEPHRFTSKFKGKAVAPCMIQKITSDFSNHADSKCCSVFSRVFDTQRCNAGSPFSRCTGWHGAAASPLN